MHKKYHVTLTVEEREKLLGMVSTGKGAARTMLWARILLKADESEQGENWADERIAEAMNVSPYTASRVRERFVERGLLEMLQPRPAPNKGHFMLDGAQEAQLTALACSPVPEGRNRWTLRLLADRMVELKHTDHLSHETVRQTLKKTISSPGWSRVGASPTLRRKDRRRNT